MESKNILLVFLALIKNSQMLSHPISSKATFHADKEEQTKLVVAEVIYCPPECFCYNLTIKCDYKELTSIPQYIHRNVSDLSVAGNRIINVTYNDSLKDIKKLNISFNIVQFLDKRWIESLLKLETLDLSHNALNSENIEHSMKIPTLQHLNLSFNNLSELTSLMFHELNVLHSLDLSYNNIKEIASNCLWDLIELQTLNLSSNKLSDLQYDWLKNLKNLKTLILRQNSLKILRNVIFYPLSNLQILDLSQISLRSLGLLSFKGLLNLQYLNISSNDITYFQDGVFRFLESLKVLDISSNPFFSIDNIFTHVPKVQFLYMNSLSNFRSLTSSSLAGLKHLDYLDISGSKMFSEISSTAFSYTRNLKHIDLSSANISTLKKGLFNNLQKLESIKLGGNPWNCNCYLYWLLIWLSEHSNAHLSSPSETYCNSPSKLQGYVLLDALDHDMVCRNATINYSTVKTKFKVGSSAFLECQVDGDPFPTLTWITPQKISFHWLGFNNFSFESDLIGSPTTNVPPFLQEQLNENLDSRFYLMPNGNLAIRNVERGDGGFYTCIASNPLNIDTAYIRLTLDYDYISHIKIVSILVGLAVSFGFLLLTLISVLIKMILKHFRIKLPCRNGNASPRTQQIKKILDSMETYKKQQLDRLRDNYNVQVQKIKDNCMQQMERLRESYSSQAERLRDIKEYGTLQIDRIRENYYCNVQRVRDYSASQIIKLRENYLFQRNRIRKFSANHLYKLRENYKLQQQHINKILENLNIESCRNVCQRTDSILFEPDINLENVLVPKICLQTFDKETCDSNETSSQISAYFTPDETGSEISGNENDDHESYENSALDKSDIVVRMEEAELIHNTGIPEQIPFINSSQKKRKRSESSLNETIV